MGISYSKNLTYAANAMGSDSAFASLSSNTALYRSCAKSAFNYEDSDIIAQASAGANIDTTTVLDKLAKEKQKTSVTN